MVARSQSAADGVVGSPRLQAQTYELLLPAIYLQVAALLLSTYNLLLTAVYLLAAVYCCLLTSSAYCCRGLTANAFCLSLQAQSYEQCAFVGSGWDLRCVQVGCVQVVGVCK